MSAMNTAIDEWNDSNADACPYTFALGSDAKEPFVLTDSSQV